jgi:hypothetical protein
MKNLETLQNIIKLEETVDCKELECWNAVCQLLCNISSKNKNRRGDEYVASCGVVPLLLELLQTLTSFKIKYGNTQILEGTQLYILKCFVQITRGCEDDFPNKPIDNVIRDGVIQTLMDVLSLYLIQKKKNNESFSTQQIEYIINIIFNISMNGIIRLRAEKGNYHENLFKDNNVKDILQDLYKTISSSSSSSSFSSFSKKKTQKYISLSLLSMLKSGKREEKEMEIHVRRVNEMMEEEEKKEEEEKEEEKKEEEISEKWKEWAKIIYL